MTISLKKFSFIGILKFKSKREQYFVLAALATAVIFFSIKFVIAPFIQSQKIIKEEIPVKLKQLEKYRQFVAGKSQAEENLKRVQSLTKRSHLKMLTGKTPPLAAAHLQDILKTLSAKNRISIKSEKVLDTKSMDFFEQIPVQVEFASTITNLTNLLYEIETYEKLLVIRDLHIKVTSRRNPRDVRATLVVSGFMEGGSSE